MKTIGWFVLALLLFINSFGFSLLLFIISLLVCVLLTIYLALDLNVGKVEERYKQLFSEERLDLLDWDSRPQLHLRKAFASTKSSPKHEITNNSLTGEQLVDAQLREVLRLAYRDLIYSWYGRISPDKEFPQELDDAVRFVIRSITQRSQAFDKVNYMTTKFVDDFASHLRLYRLAKTRYNEIKHTDPDADLISLFFNYELQMEKTLCRDYVSQSDQNAEEFLYQICDIIQYLVIPVDVFKNRPIRLLLRSMFVTSVFKPLLEKFSDPDFVNQTIVWLCKGYLESSETFLTVIRCTDNPEELTAVREMVAKEITVQRSKDTGGDDDFEIKQLLSSLLYVQSLIDSRMKHMKEGTADSLDSDSTGLPTQISPVQHGKLFSLPFDVILKNNVALCYFIEYMSSINAQGYVHFYLNVESFKVSAEQMLSEEQLIKLGKSEIPSLDLEPLKKAAENIYDTYLNPEKAAHKLKLEDHIIRKIQARIQSEKLSEIWFDEVQNRVFEIMRDEDRFYHSFKKSSHYVKLLAELDLLKDVGSDINESRESSKNFEDTGSLGSMKSLGDSESLKSFEEGIEVGDDFNKNLHTVNSDILTVSSSTSGIESSPEPLATIPELFAEIYDTGVVREFGNAYGVYAITVNRKLPNLPEEKWCVLRRYSDFYALNQHLVDRFPYLDSVNFPGKKTFNNTSREFLEQRRHQLNWYLQQLIRISQHNENLKVVLTRFLEPGNFAKQKGNVSKTVDAIFKQGIKGVGSFVKFGGDSVMDSLQKIGRTITSVPAAVSGNTATNTNNVTVTSNPRPSHSRSSSLTGVAGILSRNNSLKVPPKPANTQSSSSTPSSVAPSPQPHESAKVSESVSESEDNIPLRIMLLLMDEVFDLKSKNLWLRRRIVAFLRQIISSIFGDTFNRKIVEYFEDLMSAAAIAEYIKSFKNSFWPNGSPAQPQQPRNYATKMRTRVAAKTLLLSSLSDELKHVIGTETTRRGLLSVFQVFQHPELNRRLIFVIMEGILCEIFPDNHLPQIFQRLHSRSSRVDVKNKNLADWPPYLHQFLGKATSSPPSYKSGPRSPSRTSPLHKRK